MNYGLMIIRDSEDWLLKTVRLGVLRSELVSGHNNITTDNDGISIELLTFDNCKSYNAYAQLMEALTNGI